MVDLCDRYSRFYRKNGVLRTLSGHGSPGIFVSKNSPCGKKLLILQGVRSGLFLPTSDIKFRKLVNCPKLGNLPKNRLLSSKLPCETVILVIIGQAIFFY